eukprot:TRINITY_DN2917_c2_g1_i3.p1 TRINITY_DN2917_c2_g1~~TRINITY_DN2917_c2_g1_i3.p1  ORF type:complete len:301 (+),score=50.04 TRINITY_DN2917_c2_g1_i3:47-949(+)
MRKKKKKKKAMKRTRPTRNLSGSGNTLVVIESSSSASSSSNMEDVSTESRSYSDVDIGDFEEYYEEEQEKEKSKGKDQGQDKTKKTGSRKQTKGNDQNPQVLSPLYNPAACAELEPDHEKRPIWITEDGQLFLEAFAPCYHRIVDFVVAVAEPKHRTHLIHEYHINKYSLYAAVSIGLSSEMILKQLRLLCKTKIPEVMELIIEEYTSRYGKLRLVLHKNGYAIESNTRELLEGILQDNVIAAGVKEYPDEDPDLSPIRHHRVLNSALETPAFPVEFDPTAVTTDAENALAVEKRRKEGL